MLSLETGHVRNYDEGAAYREYFATDDLMFQIPTLDTRLKNKDEVFTVLLGAHPDRPLAISADFLTANPVHHDAIENTALVVLTDPSGGNRAYASEDVTFTSYDGDRSAQDVSGMTWTLGRARPDRRGRAGAPPHPRAARLLVRLVRGVPAHAAGAVGNRISTDCRCGVQVPICSEAARRQAASERVNSDSLEIGLVHDQASEVRR